MGRRLVIWGAGGHGLVVADIVRRVGWYDLIGFLDDVRPERRGEEFANSSVLGGREQVETLRETGFENFIIAIGDNEARRRLASWVQSEGFCLAAAIHPRATMPNDFMIGAGTVIMAGAVVQPGCQIGENVIINTGATVDHGCVIYDGAHIAPGAHLGGNVQVFPRAFIGMGAVIVPGVTIDVGAIVGAGAVVLKDVSSGAVCYGNPARVIRNVKPGDFARIA